MDVDMTDWIAKDDIESPPTSPTLSILPPISHLRIHPQAPDNVPFDFSIDITEVAEVVGQDESPISPRRTAWEWTAGDIGIALSPPVRTDSWHERMEDVDSEEEEEGEVDILWEKDVDKRLSV